MGVTHKLNPEVLDYILRQKQTNPGLGCRKLAELVSAHFRINVSKSSINNVLKQHQLSNSVGRPSKKAKEKMKKFQIPSDKKQQISEALHKIPLPDNVQSDIVDQDEGDATIIAAPETGDHTTTPAAPAEAATQQTEWGEAVTMKYAGGMFLLAAFYETMDETVLGSLLSDYSQQPDRKQFERKCNAALLMSSLNVEDVKERAFLLRKQADFDFSDEDLDQFLDSQTSDVDRILLQTKIDLELSQLSNRSTGYLVTLESGQTIGLTSRLSIRSGAIDPSTARRIPMKSAVGKLSEEILVNNQPYLFYLEEDADPQSAVQMMAAFERQDGCKITSINILGDEGEPQLDFSYITDKRRAFVYGAFPGGADFDKFIRASQWAAREQYTDRESRKWEFVVTRPDYKANQMSGIDAGLFAISLWREGATQPELALVTNLSENHNILLDRHLGYFCGAFAEPGTQALERSFQMALETEAGEYNSLRDVFLKFGGYLSDHAQREYFEGSANADGRDNFLGLRGAVTSGKAVVEVVFSGENHDADTVMKLKKAVENVNMRKIYDTSHRILRFYVK